jgi:hypothetical protein
LVTFILNTASKIIKYFDQFGSPWQAASLPSRSALRSSVRGRLCATRFKPDHAGALATARDSDDHAAEQGCVHVEALPGNRVMPKCGRSSARGSEPLVHCQPFRPHGSELRHVTFMAGGIPGMTEAEYKQWKAGRGDHPHRRSVRQSCVHCTASRVRLLLPLSAAAEHDPRCGRLRRSSCRSAARSCRATRASGLVGDDIITGANIPVQRRDKNGRVFYADPVTGKRVPKPPLLARNSSGRIVSTISGKFAPNVAGKNGVTSSVLRAFGAPTTAQIEAATFGAMTTVEMHTQAERSTQTGVAKALAHIKSPNTAGLAMYAGAIKKFIGPIVGSLALIGGIEGLAESKDPSLLGKVKDILSGVTQGVYAGPTKKAEANETQVQQFLGAASKKNVTDFNPLVVNALTNNSFSKLGGKGVSSIEKGTIAGVPRLDLSKLNEDQKEALKKFGELVQAGKELSRKKITIPLDGSVTTDDANKVIFAFDQLKQLAGSDIESIRKRVQQNSGIIKDTLGKDSEAGKQALSRNFTIAVGDIRASMKAGVVSTKSGMDAIRKLFEQNLKAWGFSATASKHYANSNTGDTAGRNNQTHHGADGYTYNTGAARGALMRIPGAVGPDSVPMNVNGQNVIAAPGEDVAIINRHQRRYLDTRLSDVGGLSGVFRGITKPHNYAQGGWVTGDTDYSPSVGSALTKMAKAKGQPIVVQSGGRTKAEQQALINKYGANNPNHPVAGLNGPHVQGIAADITPGREVFGDVANRFGLGFTVPNESWHVQLLNAAAAAAGGTGDTSIERVMAKGVSGQLGDIVQGVLDTARTVVNKTLSGFASSGGAGGDGTGKTTAGGTYNKSMLSALWKQAGGDPSVANLMAAIALAESGGNPSIPNTQGSGALGLWQILGNPFPGDATDPLTNARMAVWKYENQGLGAWEAYTNGDYKQYMARGGILHAISGLLMHGVTPPTTGVDPGAPDTSDAVTTEGANSHVKSKRKSSKKKKKKTKKSTRDIAGGKPTLGAGISRSAFKPSATKSLPIRKSIKKLLEGHFKYDSFGADDLFDPYTGEQLDLGDIYPGVHNLDVGGGIIQGLQDQLGIAQTKSDNTEESFLVTMEDTDQYADLSNYLRSIGEQDPDAWMAKYGESYELVNDVPGGRVVQGKHVRGIVEYIGEMNELLGFHLTKQINPLQGLMGGGILGMMQWQQNYAGTIPAEQAIAERQTKLAQIKKATEATIELRKAQFRKMSKMKQKGYSWHEAVEHNKDIITKWQNWKRDSYGETHGESRQANSEIDRLKEENKKLTHDKPKGRIFGDANYQHEYQMYQRSRSELTKLVGDPSVQSYAPQAGLDTGLAGNVLLTLAEWKEIRDYKNGLLTDLKSGIPQEELAIDSIKENITNALGTTAAIPQLQDQAGGGSKTQEIAALQNLIASQNYRDALARETNFSVLSGVAPLVRQRYVGSFWQGGLVPETGMALVHKGEFINPAPDGPMRNGSNAAPNVSVGGGTTELHLHGELAALVKLVDARIDSRAATTTSAQLGRRQKIIRAAPGR